MSNEFIWNIEDGVFYKEKIDRNLDKHRLPFSIEYEVSRETKIKFVDDQQDGKLSYILELAAKFEAEKADMPKDKWGYVKTVSLKAWIKRNDTRNLLDDDYHYGSIRFFNLSNYSRYIYDINTRATYDTFDDYVDEIFHRQLMECTKREREWYLAHDEYSILKKQFDDHHYTTFGARIAFCSNGEILVVSEDDDEKKRPITLNELKELIAKNQQIDDLIAKLTAETNIKY